MKCLRAALYTILLLSISYSAASQVRRGEVAFERNDRVLTWRTKNNGSFKYGERAGISFDSNLRSSLSMATGRSARDRWFDVIENRATMTYRLSDRLDFLLTAREDWNKDTMSQGGRLFTNDLDGVFKVRPISGLRLDAGVGHVFDERFDNRDRGARFTGGIGYERKIFRNFKLDIETDGEQADMRRSREMQLSKAELGYSKRDVNVSLRLMNDYNRRGYFSDIDRSTIEKRKREEQTFVLSVGKGDVEKLESKTAFEVTADLGRKVIEDTANDDERSTKYQNNADGDEKGFGFRMGRHISRRITARWGMDYGKVDNGVERLSRKRTQTDVGMQGAFDFGIGRADSIEVEGLVKRTRIDTPSGVANDRDELKMEGGVVYTRYFSDIFETSLDFRVLETHYVNIDVSQSGQNKWMKTYIFSPSLEYRPMRSVRIEHTVNVYANYIDYDYDDDFNPRSNISRRVASESWIDYYASSRTHMRFGMMLEKNDYGLLNSRGDKLPLEEGIKRFGDVSVEYRLTDWLMITPSYVYSIRRDLGVSGGQETIIRREVDQTYGLQCRLFATENGSVDLSFRRIVRNAVRQNKTYPVRIRNYITMRLTYGF